MNTYIVALLVLINISLLLAMPSSIINQDDDLIFNDHAFRPVANRFALSPWMHKRTSALCDYRLQHRPLSLKSSLCGFGHNRDEHHQAPLFKYG